jgi:hypothetical protein
VTEKMLLEVLEAQSHNSDICDSKTETLQLWRKVEEDDVEGVLFVQRLRTENRLELLPVLRVGGQGPLYQDNSNNQRQF